MLSSLLYDFWCDSGVHSFLEDGFPLAIDLFDLLFCESERVEHVLLFFYEFLVMGFFLPLPSQDHFEIYAEPIALAGLSGFEIILAFYFASALLDVCCNFTGNADQLLLRHPVSYYSGPDLFNFGGEAALEGN